MEAWARWLRLQTFNDPELEHLVRLCGRFARAMLDGEPPFWLSILGKSGTGKSHCAKRLWTLHDRLRWDHTRYSPSLLYWPRFMDELRESIRDGTGIGRLLDIERWPFAIFDDIGSERDSTGFASEKLNMVGGMRVAKWTVFTSNLGLEGISKIDDRLASRIVREPGNLIIEMTTRDYGLRDKT